MRERITDGDLYHKRIELGRLLGTHDMSMHMGNSTHKITNKLIVNNVNLWPDAMGGYSKRDAYNALRLMISALAFKVDNAD